MKVTDTELEGVRIVAPRVFGDARGYFTETWHRERYLSEGLPGDFVQDNLSRSAHGVLRGLHFQHPQGQGKLVYVLEGEVYDVAVDIRAGSPTFGRWTAVTLSADNHLQLYIPPGYAHGFCVTSPHALFAYKCTEAYRPEAEGAVRWDDPALGIPWPVRDPRVSEKDQAAPRLQDWPRERLPQFG